MIRPAPPVHHLPAYVALERWAPTRRVVVVAPADASGPRRLLAAGARGVIVVGGDLPPIPGTERYEGVPKIPAGDATVDMVACIEAYGTLGDTERRQLVREAYRVLRPGGIFAAWIRHPPGPEDTVDFWTLEEELSAVYERTYMVAQMPWRGFSLAPVLDQIQGGGQAGAEGTGSGSAPTLTLDEGLLDVLPEASHYLAIAFRQRPSAKLVERLTAECLLVPTPELVPEPVTVVPTPVPVVEARVELDALREELGHARVREATLTQQVTSLQAEMREADAAARELEQSADVQLQAARDESQRHQARARALEQDLSRRVQALQGEVAQARKRAKALEEGLEERVAVLREQAEQAAARARALEEQLAQVREEDLPRQLEALRQQLQRSQAAYEDTEAEREELQTQLRTKTTDITVLTGSVRDLEQSLARMSERLEARARELESQASARAELQQRHDALVEERDRLEHQVQVAIAEREGARQLAARVEAELEQARRRQGEQQEALSVRTQEASRLAGEQQALRERLQHQEAMLDQTRSRAEELSATAAAGHEQGRMLAEVARDRDNLREELSKRAAEIDRLDERLWEIREELQKERLDAVRMAAELERLREQSDRARESEQARAREVEQLSKELRTLEVEHAESLGALRSRDEEASRLRRDLAVLSGESADLASLRVELGARGRELAEREDQLQQARAREADAMALARRREQQLAEAGVELDRLRKAAEEGAGLTAGLRSELDVRALAAEQLAASMAAMQRQAEELRAERRKAEAVAEQLQRRIEQEAGEQEALRRRLRSREQELEEVVSTNESSGSELYRLRRELEVAAQANEELEQALSRQGDVEEGPTLLQEQQWPEEAIGEIRRLKGLLADTARRHVEQLQRVESLAGAAADGNADADRRRARMLELEVTVRAEEQEQLLGMLESAEQKIWEMTDASDRNAARLAAGLAQLEKHKEQIDELHDELEVSRTLLAAAQARALEQERLLASERAKLARAGIGPDGLPPGARGSDTGQEVDDLFAELDAGTGGTSMVDLEGPTPRGATASAPEAGAPKIQVADQAGSMSSPAASRSNPRMVIEALADGEWPDPPAELDDVDGKDDASKKGLMDKGRPGPANKLGPPPKPPQSPRVALVRDRADDADGDGGAGNG
jgi:chromosome segregation ATPase/SAM-dependent methyltransferase